MLMQINMDMGQMALESEQVYQMCASHKECKDCPIKENGAINTGTSIWSCENASNVQK